MKSRITKGPGDRARRSPGTSSNLQSGLASFRGMRAHLPVRRVGLLGRLLRVACGLADGVFIPEDAVASEVYDEGFEILGELPVAYQGA